MNVTCEAQEVFGGRRREKAEPARKEPRSPRVSRKARQLALAYYVERLVDAGELEGYAEAARLLGVSRARMTQIMDLLGMPAAEQEQVTSSPTEFMAARRSRGYPARNGAEVR